MTFRSQDDAEVRTRRSLVGVFALVGDVDANGAELAGLRKSTGASLDGVAEVTSAASATLAGLEARTDKDLAVQAAAAKEVAKLLADRDAVLEEMHADVHESVDPLVSSQHTRTHAHTHTHSCRGCASSVRRCPVPTGHPRAQYIHPAPVRGRTHPCMHRVLILVSSAAKCFPMSTELSGSLFGTHTGAIFCHHAMHAYAMRHDAVRTTPCATATLFFLRLPAIAVQPRPSTCARPP